LSSFLAVSMTFSPVLALAADDVDYHGIAKLLASFGRDGDTELIHVNKNEIEILRSLGGRGTVNPITGLLEFASGNAGGSSGEPGGDNTGGTSSGGPGGGSAAPTGGYGGSRTSNGQKATSDGGSTSNLNDKFGGGSGNGGIMDKVFGLVIGLFSGSIFSPDTSLPTPQVYNPGISIFGAVFGAINKSIQTSTYKSMGIFMGTDGTAISLSKDGFVTCGGPCSSPDFDIAGFTKDLKSLNAPENPGGIRGTIDLNKYRGDSGVSSGRSGGDSKETTNPFGGGGGGSGSSDSSGGSSGGTRSTGGTDRESGRDGGRDGGGAGQDRVSFVGRGVDTPVSSHQCLPVPSLSAYAVTSTEVGPTSCGERAQPNVSIFWSTRSASSCGFDLQVRPKDIGNWVSLAETLPCSGYYIWSGPSASTTYEYRLTGTVSNNRSCTSRKTARGSFTTVSVPRCDR